MLRNEQASCSNYYTSYMYAKVTSASASAKKTHVTLSWFYYMFHIGSICDLSRLEVYHLERGVVWVELGGGFWTTPTGRTTSKVLATALHVHMHSHASVRILGSVMETEGAQLPRVAFRLWVWRMPNRVSP